MAAIIDAGLADMAPAALPPKARHVAAVVVGNALEFYDFLTYAFFAAQIGRTFFPSADPTSSLLASLATFGAGFLMRPVGALVIGRLGDRLGRKPAMLLTFVLMGVAMVGLALTPSYRAIGMAAPALAILCRLVQGFALGGEVGPNTAYLIEAAPPRRRGLYVAFQFMSQDIAILASGLVGLALSSAMNDAALDAWGWRVAFLLGAVIIPFGLLLRRELAETLSIARSGPAAGPTPAIGRVVVLGLAMLTGGTVVTYVINYLTTYASSTLHMATRVSFLPTVAMGLTGVIFAPVGGWLSDRFGRRPVMIAPWALLLFAAIPGFWLLDRERTVLALVGMAVAFRFAGVLSFPSVMVSVAESLPARMRSGALGLIYALAISVFGGTTQFGVAWLTRATGSPLAPGWYMTAAVAIGLLAMTLTPETAPAKADR